MNLLHHLVKRVAESPHTIAICERNAGRDRSISYQQLYAQICGVSRSLSESGLRKGNQVQLLLPVGIDLYVVLLGCLHAGLVPILLDPSAGVSRMRQCLKITEIMAFVGVPKAHLLRFIIPQLRNVRAFCPSPFFPFAKRLKFDGPLFDPSDVKVDAPALLTFTSGSTGQPKAAVRTHEFLLSQDAALRKAILLEKGEVDLITLPVFVLANLSAGATSVIADTPLALPGAPDHQSIKRQCDDWKVTRCSASPAFFEGLMHGDMPQLQKIFTGGAPVFPDLLNRIKTRLPLAQVTALYGSTEAEPIADLRWNDEFPQSLIGEELGLCAGIPVPEVKVKIIADQWGTSLGPWTENQFFAQQTPQGQAGEIVVTGKHVLSGYLGGRGDDETKIRIENQVWHRTGDAGFFDAVGRLWLLGRCSAKLPASDDFPIVYPLMIEAILRTIHSQHRAVAVEHGGKRAWVYEIGWPHSAVANASSALNQYGFTKAVSVSKIPLDQRHQAKVDYVSLHRMLQSH